MPRSATDLPLTDPTPIFEIVRSNYAIELLSAAVAHLKVFDHLQGEPLTLAALGERVGLAQRPITVLVTALRAMGFVEADGRGQLMLTPVAQEHLLPGGPFYAGDYVSLSADSPGAGHAGSAADQSAGQHRS